MFKDFPLSSIHPLARPAAEAARCAGDRGKYWPYHDRLFENQPRFEREQLVRYAADIGLDRDAFARCLDEGRFAAAVAADVAQGAALGISATPTFLIGDQMVTGYHPVEVFRSVIEELLARRR